MNGNIVSIPENYSPHKLIWKARFVQWNHPLYPQMKRIIIQDLYLVHITRYNNDDKSGRPNNYSTKWLCKICQILNIMLWGLFFSFLTKSNTCCHQMAEYSSLMHFCNLLCLCSTLKPNLLGYLVNATFRYMCFSLWYVSVSLHNLRRYGTFNWQLSQTQAFKFPIETI